MYILLKEIYLSLTSFEIWQQGIFGERRIKNQKNKILLPEFKIFFISHICFNISINKFHE